MKELNHTFGDDWTFYISYESFLKFYPIIDRIRLIGPEWTIAQQWASVNVPWLSEYLDTSFTITVTRSGPVVFVLSQPDTRYFRGFDGRYRYSLHFRLYKDHEDTYLIRSMEHSGSMRSCNAETVLEPGKYEILVKVTAVRLERRSPPSEIIREFKDQRRERLLSIGRSFDHAHSKGKLRELEYSNARRRAKDVIGRARKVWAKNREKKQRELARRKLRKDRRMEEIKRRRQAKHQRFVERRRMENASRSAAERKQYLQQDDDITGVEFLDTLEGEPLEILTDGSEKGENAHSSGKHVAYHERLTERARDGRRPDMTQRQQYIIPTSSGEEGELDGRRRVTVTDSDAERGPTKSIDEQTSDLCRPLQQLSNAKTHEQQNEKQVRIPYRQGPSSPRRATAGRDRSLSREISRPLTPLSSPIGSVEDEDFPWDNAIDGPPTPTWDEGSDDDIDSADELYGKDPWQATCVVGLRVCSMDENLKLEVVKGSDRARRVKGEVD